MIVVRAHKLYRIFLHKIGGFLILHFPLGLTKMLVNKWVLVCIGGWMSFRIYGIFSRWFPEKYLEGYMEMSKKMFPKFNEISISVTFISASNSEFLLPFLTEISAILIELSRAFP